MAWFWEMVGFGGKKVWRDEDKWFERMKNGLGG